MEDLELEIESSVDRKYIECGACKGKGIAVLTSGGDAQGDLDKVSWLILPSGHLSECLHIVLSI